MRVSIEKPQSVYVAQWQRKFQWLPRVTSDGKHFVWLEYVLARQWGKYGQVKLSPERGAGYTEVHQ